LTNEHLPTKTIRVWNLLQNSRSLLLDIVVFFLFNDDFG